MIITTVQSFSKDNEIKTQGTEGNGLVENDLKGHDLTGHGLTGNDITGNNIVAHTLKEADPEKNDKALLNETLTNKALLNKTPRNDTHHRLFILSVLAVVMSTLALLLSVFKTPLSSPVGVHSFGLNAGDREFVVVDMAKLLRKKASTLVFDKGQRPSTAAGNIPINNTPEATNPKNIPGATNPTDLPDASPKVAGEARAIRSTLERYAAANKVIVVAKGAVFGENMREVTDEIDSLL